jgi:CrcB protein
MARIITLPPVTALYVAVAGAAGVLARYWLSNTAEGERLLWTTAAINLVGSFALGVVVVVGWWTPEARTAVGAGLLGGFTTYSTFSVQAVVEADGGRWGTAVAYVLVSVVGGIAAAAAGYALARSLRG